VTGAGKTRLGIEAVSECLARAGKSVVVVPGKPLLYQWRSALRAALPGVRVGLLGDGCREHLRDVEVLVSTVNLARSTDLGLRSAHGLLVADECHRYGSDVNRFALAGEFRWRLGLSATHERTDGFHETVIEPYFSGVVFRYGYAQAIAEGVVARFLVALIGVAFSDDERAQYEYLSEKLRRARTVLLHVYKIPAEPFGVFIKAVNELSVHGNKRESIAAGQYLSVFNRRKALLAETEAKIDALARLEQVICESSRVIIFTQTVAATMRVHEELVDLGVDADCLHSRMDAASRRDVLARFKNGQLHAIVAPQLLDEGLDVPSADLGIIVAASRQRRQMIQRMGRCLRPKESGARARFVVLYVQGTSEDPRHGAHDSFLDEITGPADAVRDFDSLQAAEDVSAFLTPTGTGCTLPATT
jgi:superfamily II DNA or RNA helicase